MRSLKWLTIVTFITTIVSISFLFLFYCLGIEWELFYDISLAIFGSAMLGFIISIIQYFAEKRKSMELFYIESLLVLNKIGEIPYYKTDEPECIINQCIIEEFMNDKNQSRKDFPRKKELIDYLKKENNTLAFDDKYYNEISDKIINEEKLSMDKHMRFYIELSEINYSRLDSAYGGLDFIFGNIKLRKTIYNNIYIKVKQSANNINEKTYHFKIFFDENNGSRPVMLDFLNMLNEYYFIKAETVNDNGEFELIYRRYYDEISASLEEYRCRIYKQKYNKRVADYLCFTMKNKSNDICE